jgi:DNA-binding NarL/FixJ family response regulator
MQEHLILHREAGPGPTHEEWQERLLAMHGAVRSEDLIQAVFRLMEATVHCDFSLVVLHAVDHLPMVAMDSQGRVFSYEFMEQSYRHNPATAYLMAHPGVPMLTTREQLPAGDEIFSHLFYERGMKPMNFRHCLALFFWDFVPLIAHQVFAVFRHEGQPDFNADEEKAMLALHPHINVALKRVRQQEREQGARESLGNMVDELHGAALMLDWDLAVSHVTAAGQEALAKWQRDNAALPETILQACDQLKARWREVLKMDPKGGLQRREQVSHPQDKTLMAEVSLIAPRESTFAHPGFLVQLQTAPKSGEEIRKRLEVLTDAERAVAMLAAACLDNQQIADRLRINVSAVKMRLHKVFKKLGIETRSQLVSALGQGA